MSLSVMLWCLLAETSAVMVAQVPPVLYTPVGRSAVMSCQTRDENLMILYYHWYLNNTNPDHILENTTRVTIMADSLIISSVTDNDSGIYICTAQDSNLQVYEGNGTRLVVQGPTPQDDEQNTHHYKYLYFLFIPLLILLLYWMFRFLATIGARTQGTQRRDKRKWLIYFKKKDGDTELHYSTIVPKATGLEIKPRTTRIEEVDYAPVKIAVPSQSFSYTPETRWMDNVVYATLRTERSGT